MPRLREESHQFLTFAYPNHLNRQWRLWRALGEAQSKCEHVAGAPLPPHLAEELSAIYMAKGVHATTAIEGNTLSEQEVADILARTADLPPSREYQGVEIKNVAAALVSIDEAIKDGQPLHLTVESVKALNRQVLQGTEHEPNAKPGHFRLHQVVIGRYRAAPSEDVEYLLDRLLTWINRETLENSDADTQFANAVIGAVTAHVYFAWIHPFGDGNGRTARLIEALVLARSGLVPLPAINLLSDHYNKTRDRYRRMFDEARAANDITPFIFYAVDGYLDGLRGQVEHIRHVTLRTSWVNYVHERMSEEPEGATRRRRRDLVLALSNMGIVKRAAISQLNAPLAAAYAVKGEKTISRDLGRLVSLGLIVRVGRHHVRANSQLMEAFLARKADPPELAD
ncbi:MAG: Fic family protein [Actinobacteria bacterium]|nr:Fic family protein [Actinomycetota bacterium]